MAYNYYPQNMYYQPQSSIIWVQGENGAKSYQIAPNNTVTLWDSEAQKIYIKSADASGMPSMKTLEYKILGGEDQKLVSSELDGIKTEIENLRKDLDRLKEELG